MDLTGILSISGYGGLFKLVKQTKTGFIVESLVDQKRMQAFATSKISTLEDIAIFTETGETHLKNVFRTIFKQEDGQKVNISVKSSNQDLKDFFGKVVPDYDKEKVYVSDIKKVALWYNLLVDKGLIDLEEDKVEETSSEETVVSGESEEMNEEVISEIEKPAKKEKKKSTKKSEESE